MALKIFVDFDGTITRQDVGIAFFREFSGVSTEGLKQEYEAEKISAKEFYLRSLESLKQLRKSEIDGFFQQQILEEGFGSFVEFCRAYGLEFHIVSDGLDYYIKEILSHSDTGDVSSFANRLRIVDSGNGFSKLEISFPFDDASCTRCACCKRNIMLTKASDDDIIVYVGEGYSDQCPVQYADYVFAKDDLQKFCQEKNISYYLYDTFDDIVIRLREMLSKKRLKKRREAEMKRREVFVCE